MRYLVIALGSYGDVHPMVGIGMALRQRGHEVAVVANGHFRPLVERAGLTFLEYGDAQAYLRITQDPDVWHPTRGYRTVVTPLIDQMPLLYRTIVDWVGPRVRESVLIAHPLAFAALIAQDKLGVPAVSVSLAPIMFRSLHQVPAMPSGADLSWLPRWSKRVMWRLADAIQIDPPIVGPINALRRELGLPPVHRPFDGWIHSRTLALGLFPEWFGVPQPDWPPQLKLVGFPLFDEAGLHPLDGALERFLAEGDAPIAFTPGSAMQFGERFFAAAVKACVRLKRRGLLLSRFDEHVPRDLPATVRHVRFAPFGELLPRCAAVVHHGGIGSVAQGLACGVPQLIMPMSHDQPDNALRARRLGVAAALRPAQFTAANVARELRLLLDSPLVAQACRACALRIDRAATIRRIVELLEGVGSRAGGDALSRPA
jgi:rhamnosyltransferase subunit B